MSKLKFKLGDRVTYTRRYWKSRNETTDETTWVSHWKFSKPNQGMIVGVRSVQEGKTIYSEYEMPCFVPNKRIRMYLIAYTLGGLPDYVKEEDITPEPQS